MTIQDYVSSHTIMVDKDDTDVTTVNMEFFKVASKATPDAEEFIKLSGECEGEFAEVNPFDGSEHGYIELGAWIGSQELALLYMGLGVKLGLFQLLTPRMLFPALLGSKDKKTEDLISNMVGSGMLTVIAKK